jgi:WhiB family redox-sensing transcriptional regulator
VTELATRPSREASGLIPERALPEWHALTTALEDTGTVPCRETDAEAWWPDRKDLDAPSTRLAVQGCWRCPARLPRLAYALAAGEREGVWSGLLPDERREMSQSAAA